MLSRRGRSVTASSTAALDATIKSMVAAGQDVISLGAGETDFPTPPFAAAGARAAIDEGFTRYTATNGIVELRQAVAEWLAQQYGLSYRASDIVVSNGGKQALFNALLALVDRGDDVLVPAPYWVSYPEMVALAGARPVFVPAAPGDGLKLTPAAIECYATARTRLLILNNPTNPSGVVYSRDELARLAEVCLRHRIVILSDEIYGQQVYPPATFHPVAGLDADVAAHTVTVGGFSKTFAMTGWRIGYAAAPGTVAAAMTAIQAHTTSAPSSVSQRAALAALLDPDRDRTLARQLVDLDQRRRMMIEAIAKIPGIRLVAEPTGAFYALVDVTDLYGTTHQSARPLTSAADIATALLDEQRLGVVPGDQFGAPGHLRLSYVANPERLAEALNRLNSFCTARLTVQLTNK